MATKDLLEMARLEELASLIRQKQAVAELLEVLNFNFVWLTRFCKENRINIPDKKRVYQSQLRIRTLIRQITSDESYHRDDSAKELPEPFAGSLTSLRTT